MFNFKQYNFRHYNIFLIVVVLITGICGAYFVKLANGAELGPYAFKKQLIGVGAGLILAILISLVDYHFICRFVVFYYIAGVLMVAATKFSPIGTDLKTGSYRWLSLGIEIQPSELCKIIIILVFAVFFNKYEDYMDRFRIFLAGALIVGLPTGFIMIQSDLSSSIVMLFIFAMMIFAAGLSYKIVAVLLAVGIPSFIAVFWYVQQPYQKLLDTYQQGRIIGFLNPEKYSNSIMYQQNYSYSAIASGELMGKLFNSAAPPTRVYRHADVIESDFIFAVIGEEVGFLGSCVIIGLLGLIIIVCLITAKRAYDRLGMLIAIGIGSMLMFQTFANIGVATRMLPNTGLPLPFISAGLSSIMSCMIGIGLLLNIGLQSSKNKNGGFSML